jgi:hypothetical protein
MEQGELDRRDEEAFFGVAGKYVTEFSMILTRGCSTCYQ